MYLSKFGRLSRFIEKSILHSFSIFYALIILQKIKIMYYE